MASTPIERLDGAHLVNAPLVKTGVFAGRTTLASGSVSATVSTTAVNSDSIIQATIEVGSLGVANAASGGNIAVNSIVSGTSFALTNVSGVAVPWDNTVMWTLYKTS